MSDWNCLSNSKPTERVYVVITTIRSRTQAVEVFESRMNGDLVVVGDRKTPLYKDSSCLRFLDFDAQSAMYPGFAERCPADHYCRKNFGYLEAVKDGGIEMDKLSHLDNAELKAICSRVDLSLIEHVERATGSAPWRPSH